MASQRSSPGRLYAVFDLDPRSADLGFRRVFPRRAQEPLDRVRSRRRVKMEYPARYAGWCLSLRPRVRAPAFAPRGGHRRRLSQRLPACTSKPRPNQSPGIVGSEAPPRGRAPKSEVEGVAEPSAGTVEPPPSEFAADSRVNESEDIPGARRQGQRRRRSGWFSCPRSRAPLGERWGWYQSFRRGSRGVNKFSLGVDLDVGADLAVDLRYPL